MFAALWRLDRRGVARGLAALGLLVTLLSIVLSCLPAPDSPAPLLATGKIVGGSAALVAAGALLFARRRRRLVPDIG